MCVCAVEKESKQDHNGEVDLSLNEYELFEKLKNATQNKVLIILEHINSICIMNVCVFASDSI